jgi:hypothetical protein
MAHLHALKIPAMQRRLRNKICSSIPAPGANEPSVSNIDSLPYLNAVYQEILRFYPHFRSLCSRLYETPRYSITSLLQVPGFSHPPRPATVVRNSRVRTPMCSTRVAGSGRRVPKQVALQVIMHLRPFCMGLGIASAWGLRRGSSQMSLQFWWVNLSSN